MDWDAAPGVDVELLGTLVPRPSMNLLQEGGGQGGNGATGATLSQLPLAVPSSAGCSFPEPTVTFETKNPKKKTQKRITTLENFPGAVFVWQSPAGRLVQDELWGSGKGEEEISLWVGVTMATTSSTSGAPAWSTGGIWLHLFPVPFSLWDV